MSPLRRWSLAPAVVLSALTGGLAAADDHCTDVTDRLAFQRALLDECASISLGGELPAMTRAITIDGSLVLDAGPWSIPPLDIRDGASVTIRDGRAEAHRAVRREGDLFPSILKVDGTGLLTLSKTTIVEAPDTPAEVHAVVLQDAQGEGLTEIHGAHTEGTLNHILLLQQTQVDTGTGDGCTLTAHASIAASDDGPSELTLAAGGVVVGALCTLDGVIQDSFGAETDRELVLERLRLAGDMTGLRTTVEDRELTLAPITTPAAVSVRESLWLDLTIGEGPVVDSESSVVLTDFLAGRASLTSAPMVTAPKVLIDRSVMCDIAGGGSIATPVGSGDVEIQRAALHRLDLPLVAEATATTLWLDNVTLTRSTPGALVEGSVSAVLRNSYIEGEWSLPDLEEADVDAVRLVATPCPAGLSGCQELSVSHVQPGQRVDDIPVDCADVLDAWFQQEAALASWPRAMAELDRLVAVTDSGDALVGQATEATTRWGCDDPPRIGAWPGEACGLPLLAYDQPSSSSDGTTGPDETEDTGALDAEDGVSQPSTPRNVYGCQGREAAASLLLLALLPGLSRRRQGSDPGQEG